MSSIYDAVCNLIHLPQKIGAYFSHLFPSQFNFIIRIDTKRGKVIDEYCLRRRLRPDDFYYISVWNRETAKYHKYFLNGRTIAQYIGSQVWLYETMNNIVYLLHESFPDVKPINTDILTIFVKDIEVDENILELRSSLCIKENVTAAALVLLWNYLNQDKPLPYYATFRSFAVDLLENAKDDEIQVNTEPESTTVITEWDDFNNVVSIIKYDMSETSCSGDQFIA